MAPRSGRRSCRSSRALRTGEMVTDMMHRRAARPDGRDPLAAGHRGTRGQGRGGPAAARLRDVHRPDRAAPGGGGPAGEHRPARPAARGQRARRDRQQRAADLRGERLLPRPHRLQPGGPGGGAAVLSVDHSPGIRRRRPRRGGAAAPDGRRSGAGEGIRAPRRAPDTGPDRGRGDRPRPAALGDLRGGPHRPAACRAGARRAARPGTRHQGRGRPGQGTAHVPAPRRGDGGRHRRPAADA